MYVDADYTGKKIFIAEDYRTQGKQVRSQPTEELF